NPCSGHPVEQRRLASIGVADDRDDRIRHLAALGAMQVAGATHLLKLFLEPDDLFLQRASVGLDLGFARTTKEARTTALTLQVGPAANQTALLIFQMREIDLQRAFTRAGTRSEDFEDDA